MAGYMQKPLSTVECRMIKQAVEGTGTIDAVESAIEFIIARRKNIAEENARRESAIPLINAFCSGLMTVGELADQLMDITNNR